VSNPLDVEESDEHALIPWYEKCLNCGGDYVEKQLKYVRIF
jgi:hypothetical protein